MKNQKTLLSLATLILSALLLIAVYTWAAPCPGQLELASGSFIPMKCLYASKAIALISVILFVLSLESIIKKRNAPFSAIVIGIALIVVTLTGPIGIGVCVKTDMACHATALWARIIGILVVIDGIAMMLVKGKSDL